MSKKKNHITHLTPELIAGYYEGILSNEEMHEVEKLMLESDFESEAMEGFETLTSSEIQSDFKKLNKALDSKIEPNGKSGLLFYLKIAASVLLIAITFFLVLEYLEPANDQITQAEESELPTQEYSSSEINQDTSRESEQSENVVEDPRLKKSPDKANELPAPKSSDLIVAKQSEHLVELDEANTKDIQAPDQEATALEGLALAETDQSEQLPEPVAENIPVEGTAENALQGQVAGVQVEEQSQKEQIATSRMKAAKKLSVPATSDFDNEDIEAPKLEGKVIALEDGSPLPGVNVTVKGTSLGTVTDIDGNFSLVVPEDSDSTLEFSFVGLASESVHATGNNDLLIEMENDVSALSEVVVIGYGVSNDDSAENTYLSAQPAIGKTEYKNYLEANLQYPEGESESGRVVIKFKVNADGSLSDFEVRRSLGEAFDNEAIRLVKEGPEWSPAKKSNESVEDYVRVRIRFKP